MRIIVDYNNQDSEIISIDKAYYLGDYVVRIKFHDATDKLVDFKPFLNKSQHPSIKKYLDETLFAKYQIIDGNLNWNDYEMIFLKWDLYNGNIET